MVVNYFDQDILKADKSIYLAGPTPKDADFIISWRKMACKLLEDKGFDGVVYVPEHSDWKNKYIYDEQVSWEMEALGRASIIVFWIPNKYPDKLGYATNAEFGYWLKNGNILYGRDKCSKKTKYLDWLYELEYNIKPFDNMEDLLDEAINKVNNNDFKFIKKM